MRLTQGEKMELVVKPGHASVVDCPSPDAKRGVIFEDDGETAYLYAVSLASGEPQILDAVHIYNFSSVRQDFVATIRWRTPLLAGLWIDGVLVAGVDFETSRAMSRTEFPDHSNWSTEGHKWDPELEARLAN